MKKYKALTVIEILTVLVVMSLLIGVLLPAVTTIMNVAKNARQKAQFITLTIATEAFKNDQGYYPPSDNDTGNYCGAQKLAEAVVGYDLFGFHPDSEWDAQDASNIYDATDDANLKARKGPYLEVEKANTVRLGDGSGGEEGLYSGKNLSNLETDTFVLTDTFKRKYTFDIDGDGDPDSVELGMPILYFKARTNKYELNNNDVDSIFDYRHNQDIVNADVPWDETKAYELNADMFYNINDEDYIVNKSITTSSSDIPYNKDSFILISAGKDGLYGTADDVFNFDKD